MCERPLWLCGAIVALVSVWTPAARAADAAAAAFADGRAALADARFEDAYRAFARAAQLDPQTDEYREEAALLRRVMMVQEKLATMKTQEEWSTAALSLHTYYFDRGVYGEALALDRELLNRAKQADNAVLLAQTLLQLDRNAEAAEVLEPWAVEDGDDHARVLRGLALARENQLAAARELAATVKLTADSAPGLALDVARLRAQLEDTEGALSALRQCLRSTPPSRLERRQSTISHCSEFAALAGLEPFAKVLQTPSEVKESPCSTGSACGACPSRTRCGDAKTAEQKEACPKQ